MKTDKKQKKQKKNGDRAVVIVGCAIIAVALAAVLCAIFVPPLVQEGNMSDFLEELTSDAVQEAVLVDMLPAGGSLLSGAVQITVEGNAWETLKNGLRALNESGFDSRGVETQKNLDVLVLRVRNAAGELLQLYLASGRFYYYPDNLTEAQIFVPEDAAAYSAFYQSLEAMLVQQ